MTAATFERRTALILLIAACLAASVLAWRHTPQQSAYARSVAGHPERQHLAPASEVLP